MLGWSPIPEKPGFGCPLHRPLRLSSRLLNAGVRTWPRNAAKAIRHSSACLLGGLPQGLEALVFLSANADAVVRIGRE